VSYLRGVAFALPVVFLSTGIPGANAGCYEIIGCTKSDAFQERDLSRMSCQILGEVRNSIYAENGYCFKKLKYQRMFGNQGCGYTSDGDVPMSRLERANVRAIRNVERSMGCAGD
jgi:hypothetical protein